ncbi:hypothetical protein CCP3SC5AM1_2110002 [Gammaproteobacteria bacterium]
MIGPKRARAAWGAWRKAENLRAQGRYRPASRRLYAQALRLLPLPWLLLRYCAFLRDLGRPFPARWVDRLLRDLRFLPTSGRKLALAALAEVAPSRTATLPRRWLKAAASIPGVAALLPNDDSAANLARWQQHYRTIFCNVVSQAAMESGICVVGNGASLRGFSLGAAIDANALVIRFNRCFGPDAAIEDIGQRINVWVVAPGYRGPATTAAWTVMTGPDMLYRLHNWQAVATVAAAGSPVLTVPLPVWRLLVRQLNAPPSSGVLLLAWLNWLLGSWRGISFVGIACGLDFAGRYHVGLSAHVPVVRHDWDAEQRLVESWIAQGLRRLSPLEHYSRIENN